MKNNEVYLKQIADFITDIEGYTKARTSDDFQLDVMLQDAVIRKLELVGEAANRLSQEFLQDHPDFPIKEAVAMRNKLIHEYDAVELDIVWTTATEDIKIIKEFIEHYFDKK